MIYKNSLGEMDARATVSIFVGTFCPRYYSMMATSDAPSHKWSADFPVQSIVKELEADGWACTIRKNGLGEPVIDCIHIETQMAIDNKKAVQDEKFSCAERGYIRFGELPVGGHSRNYRDDKLEVGVSCFEAEITKDGSYRLLLTPKLKVSYLTVCMRQAYRLYGEVVGTGADGEPLLAVSKSVKLDR